MMIIDGRSARVNGKREGAQGLGKMKGSLLVANGQNQTD